MRQRGRTGSWDKFIPKFVRFKLVLESDVTSLTEYWWPKTQRLIVLLARGIKMAEIE